VKERYLETISKSKVFGTYIINDQQISKFQENQLINLIKKSNTKDSIFVISDYGHGLITKYIAKYFSKLGKKIFLNTQLNAGNWGRHSLFKYKNINTLLLNERELRYEMRDDNANINLIAKKLMKDLKISNLIITKGASGAILVNLKYGKIITAPALTSNVIDKVGSGDAMLSIMSLCLKKKIPYDLALFFGIIIGSLSVQVIGNKKQITKLEFLKTIEYLLK
jgi:bifunctional ADP-heptose synthase (sugar kinase/adenylyltransferase)